MSQARLLDLITIGANMLSLSAAIGLLFGVIVQPRRERANWLFALFLITLSVWSFASLVLSVPALDTTLDPTSSFYIYLSCLGPIPLIFFVAALSFCRIRTVLTRLMTALTIPLAIIGIVSLWNGDMFRLDTNSLPEDVTISVLLSHFDILQPGFIAIVITVTYMTVLFLYLRVTPGERSRSLQLPALLLLLANGGHLFEPLSRIPFGTTLTTVAAVLIGYSIIAQQLFNPLSEMNDKLQSINADLRNTVEKLATEQRRVEALNQDLRAASEYKSDFLSTMSHELRTPLNSIVGYSELLLQNMYGDLNAKQRDRLGKIHRNGRDLLMLINDILDLSKIEAGRLELSFQHLHLNDHIDQVKALIAPQIEEKGLQFALDIPEDLAFIFADPLRVQQILTNLLGNAAKFTEEGSITVKASNITISNGSSDHIQLPARGWLTDGKWVLIKVVDTGIGIPRESHAQIFEEFHQVDKTATREHRGTGLGLAITKKLVDMHGGIIWLTSDVGSGTTFYVTLPASSHTPVPAPVHSDPPPADKRTRHPHVLVIDDSQEATDILSSYLQEAGYRVTQASSGEMGIRLAQELQPDLVTTDIMMPGLSGWEVIDRLSTNPFTNSIPVIIVSVVDKKPQGLAPGVSAHINKPVQRRELLDLVGRYKKDNAAQHPVLIVDDNENVRDLMADVLRAAEYPVVTCTGGQEAIDWLQDHAASLVLLDLMMPEVSGFEVLTRIRENPDMVDLPVLIVSAKELTPEEIDFLDGNLTSIITKRGLQRDDLLAQIKSAVG